MGVRIRSTHRFSSCPPKLIKPRIYVNLGRKEGRKIYPYGVEVGQLPPRDGDGVVEMYPVVWNGEEWEDSVFDAVSFRIMTGNTEDARLAFNEEGEEAIEPIAGTDEEDVDVLWYLGDYALMGDVNTNVNYPITSVSYIELISAVIGGTEYTDLDIVD